MNQAEEKRLAVTPDMIKHTRAQLKESRVPGPRNPRAKDEGQPAEFECLVCGELWKATYQSNQERNCPSCRSNSVRWIRKR